MKTLIIQFQPDLAKTISEQEVISRIESFVARSTVVALHDTAEGDDDGRYISFTFQSEALPQLWAEIQEYLYQDARIGDALTASSIVTCEGSYSWDDYLLLHHFDQREERDAL